MKAMLYDYREAPFGMVWRNDLVKPTLSGRKNTVLVAIKTVGLNPVDFKLVTLPVVGRFLARPAAMDFSGVVVEAGPNDLGLKVGDEVFGQSRNGTLVEYAEAHISALTLKPPTVSHAHASALPVAAITGLQSLRDYGKLTAGARVLVIGASGGCGMLGVQIAKALGASHVTGICSARNSDAVKALGADVIHAYDAGNGPLPKIAADRIDDEGFDVVYDTVTSPEDYNYEPEAKALIRNNGQYVQINASPVRWVMAGLKAATGINLFPRNTSLMLAAANTADLAIIGKWIADGDVKVVIEKEFDFTNEGVLGAFEMLKGRRTRGKVIVKVA
jgi:NADPH:quinone reductase-like Zn-dependent oxidoreductase